MGSYPLRHNQKRAGCVDAEAGPAISLRAGSGSQTLPKMPYVVAELSQPHTVPCWAGRPCKPLPCRLPPAAPQFDNVQIVYQSDLPWPQPFQTQFRLNDSDAGRVSGVRRFRVTIISVSKSIGCWKNMLIAETAGGAARIQISSPEGGWHYLFEFGAFTLRKIVKKSRERIAPLTSPSPAARPRTGPTSESPSIAI